MVSTTGIVSATVGSLLLCAGLLVVMNETGSNSPTANTETSLTPASELAAKKQYTCIDRWHRCTNNWCDVNCNHNPSYCPWSFCRAAATAPKAPPKPPPVPPPTNKDPMCLGGVMGVYYSSATSRGDATSVKGNAICCPKECGTCGGEDCGGRPGGASACCADKVFASGKQCASNTAPCVGVDLSQGDAQE